MTLERTEAGVVDCAPQVGIYSAEVQPGLPSEPFVPRKKGRAGLRKSTDTRKNNNRVALRDFTCGRRCVTDVVMLNPPLVAVMKVVNGVSGQKVLRKNKRSMLLDAGQRFGVLQLFVEGHPKPDEKVWVTTNRGVVPVSSTAVQQTMEQLTVGFRSFPVIARGKVRRDPQKQGTRPKAGEPIIDCYGIFVGDEGKPLWVESSLVTVQQQELGQQDMVQSMAAAPAVPETNEPSAVDDDAVAAAADTVASVPESVPVSLPIPASMPVSVPVPVSAVPLPVSAPMQDPASLEPSSISRQQFKL